MDHPQIIDRFPPAAEGSRLVSCCPGLQSLNMSDLKDSTGLLVALHGLSGLHTLRAGYHAYTGEGCQAVCQLTGLKELNLVCSSAPVYEGVLRQLTQLKHLTVLDISSWGEHIRLTCGVS